MNHKINYKDTTKRLFTYFNHFKMHFFGGVFFIAIGSVAVIVFNGMLSPFFDSLLTNYNFETFSKYLILFGLVALFITLTHYWGLHLLRTLAQNVVFDIREDLFSHIQDLPMSYFNENAQGDVMSTINNDVNMLNIALEESISQIVNSIITIIGTFIIMMILSVPLTILILVMMFLILFVVKYISVKSNKYFRNQQAELADINAFTVEMMSGQKVIKTFNHETEAINDFRIKNDQLQKTGTYATIFGIMVVPIIGSLSYAAYALVAVFGGYLVVLGSLTIGNIAAYLQFTRTFFNPVTQVSNQMNTLFSALAGAERIFALLDENLEINEGFVHLEERDDKKYWNMDGILKEVKGDICFECVSFGYSPKRKILKDVSLYAKPNQKIAFVGSTGAGKTTITNLINRFYDVDDGRITFDGIDIKDIKKEDLRSTMSVVLQDVNLFEGSIKENIRYGRLDASDEEVVEAAKVANAHYFIQLLPDGYDTILNAEADNLSQGERQLLAIARAALANPSVLILDEATSSVDTRTEALIAGGMEKLMANRTTFVIAHRLSTVRDADAIMVLEHGEIIERGMHDDLMSLQKTYYDLNVGKIELK